MKIAVFPGSFDPFTLAHEDLVNRALPLFDKIIIAVGTNSSKKSLLSVEQKLASIQAIFSGIEQVEATTYKGLTVDFCRSVDAGFLLRGLRNSTDFDFENAIAQNNLILAPEVESYFLLARTGLSHISSTIVRDILANKGDISTLVPKAVLEVLDSED